MRGANLADAILGLAREPERRDRVALLCQDRVRRTAGSHRIVARLSDGGVMQRTVEVSAETDSVVFY